MENDNKLVIQSQKYRGDTTVVSMRMPKDMLTDVDEIAEKTGKTRNELLMLSIEYAIKNMEIV